MVPLTPTPLKIPESLKNITPFLKTSKSSIEQKPNGKKKLKSIFHSSYNRLSPEYKSLATKISLLKKIIQDKVRIWLSRQFEDRLSQIKPGPLAFKEAHRFLGKNKKYSCNKLTIEDRQIIDEQEIADQFKIYFNEVYKEKVPLSDPTHIKNIQSTVLAAKNQIPPHIFIFCPSDTAYDHSAREFFTSFSEVQNFIKQMNAKKSAGPDEISNFVIKKLPPTAIKFLVIIFNNCLNNGYFPKNWKKAKLIPLQKNKNCHDPKNFRPISMLSNIGKILERIILFKIDNFVDDNIEFLPDLQFGFRKGHSTVHALLKVHKDVTDNLKEKKCIIACSLDVEKAFDGVWRDGLIYKILQLNYPRHLINIIISFLSESFFFYTNPKY